MTCSFGWTREPISEWAARGSWSHERFEHGFHGSGFGFYTPYSDDGYAPGSCYWQDGYWGPNQPYIDQYGFERFEPVWVPGQSVCY